MRVCSGMYFCFIATQRVCSVCVCAFSPPHKHMRTGTHVVPIHSCRRYIYDTLSSNFHPVLVFSAITLSVLEERLVRSSSSLRDEY